MKRLLIVDDNADHRLILRTMLEGKGYACEEAEDGTEALKQLVAKPIDLVLTDLNMPRTDGFQLIEQMEEQTQLQEIPVILITSQAPSEVPQFSQKGQLQAILSKPYECQEILSVIAGAIDPSRLTDSPSSRREICHC